MPVTDDRIRPTERRPEPALRPPAVDPTATEGRHTLSPAAVRSLQTTAGNQATARMIGQLASRATLMRESSAGDHPLAIALDVHTWQLREQVGADEFQTLNGWWKINALSPIIESTTPFVSLRSLARNFAGVGMDELAQLIAGLTGPLGVPTFVTLTPAHARFLLRHLARAQVAYSVLVTVGNSIQYADAVLQMLAPPHLGNPAHVAIAHGELVRLGDDAARAKPIVELLLRYADDPVAYPVARQELQAANDDPVAARKEMDALAPYNYDRSLRTGTAAKAHADAQAEQQAAVQQAAAVKALAHHGAAATEADWFAHHTRPGLPTGKKRNPTSVRTAEKAQGAYDAEAREVHDARLAAESQADADETKATGDAARDAVATEARIVSGVEGFIAATTQSHDAPTANFLIQAAGFDIVTAGIALALFPGADAQAHAGWALATCGADQPKLRRAVAHLAAAVQASLPTAQAQAVVTTLLALKVGDAVRPRLLALARDHAAEWDAVAAFLGGAYADRIADGATALEQAHAHGLPLADLAKFGSGAHVFTGFLAQRPALFLRLAPWLLTIWPARHPQLEELCAVAQELDGLPQPTVELLALDHRAEMAALRAVPGALAYVAGIAATADPAVLEAELPWYAQWIGELGVADMDAVVTAFPDLAERKSLSKGLADPDLSPQLVAAKTARTAQEFKTLTDVVTLAVGLQTDLADLAAALEDIDAYYPGAAGGLYKLLLDHKVSSPVRAIRDAASRDAPLAYIAWVVERAGGVASDRSFLGHLNAFCEFLSQPNSPHVRSTTVRLNRQKLAGSVGNDNDVLHIFHVNFMVIQPGGPDVPVHGEVHNHVNRATRRQTSMHWKNGDKGRELPSATAFADACRQAVASAPDTRTPLLRSYTL